MFKQYSTRMRTNRQLQRNQKQKSHHRKAHSSLQYLEDPQRIQKKGKLMSPIDERIEKLKKKYKSDNQYRKQLIELNSFSMYFGNWENKENQTTMLNTSMPLNDIKSDMQRTKQRLKSIKMTQDGNRQKKRLKQTQKIRELQQINMKISTLIQKLKDQQQQPLQKQIRYQQKQFDVQRFEPTIIPISKSTLDFQKLNNSKLSTIQVKRSRFNTQSSNHSNRSSKSVKSSHRQNGKILKTSSIPKSFRHLKTISMLESGQQNMLSKYFKKQIQLDKVFNKYKTKIFKQAESKSLIQNTLRKNNNLSSQQKQMILEINFQQIDPLYTERENRNKEKIDQNYLVNQLIDSFINSQKHWKQKIYKKFNEKEINLSDLDLQQKGYFLKQDLTRFLSLLTKNMYSNRQVNLIFKRINKKKGKIVSTSQLIKTLCN